MQIRIKWKERRIERNERKVQFGKKEKQYREEIIWREAEYKSCKDKILHGKRIYFGKRKIVNWEGKNERKNTYEQNLFKKEERKIEKNLHWRKEIVERKDRRSSEKNL